jgi:hypothetical protein
MSTLANIFQVDIVVIIASRQVQLHASRIVLARLGHMANVLVLANLADAAGWAVTFEIVLNLVVVTFATEQAWPCLALVSGRFSRGAIGSVVAIGANALVRLVFAVFDTGRVVLARAFQSGVTIATRVRPRAVAFVRVDPVHAQASIVASGVETHIDPLVAVDTRIAGLAAAVVVAGHRIIDRVADPVGRTRVR